MSDNKFVLVKSGTNYAPWAHTFDKTVDLIAERAKGRNSETEPYEIVEVVVTRRTIVRTIVQIAEEDLQPDSGTVQGIRVYPPCTDACSEGHTFVTPCVLAIEEVNPLTNPDTPILDLTRSEDHDVIGLYTKGQCF